MCTGFGLVWEDSWLWHPPAADGQGEQPASWYDPHQSCCPAPLHQVRKFKLQGRPWPWGHLYHGSDLLSEQGRIVREALDRIVPMTVQTMEGFAGGENREIPWGNFFLASALAAHSVSPKYRAESFNVSTWSFLFYVFVFLNHSPCFSLNIFIFPIFTCFPDLVPTNISCTAL